MTGSDWDGQGKSLYESLQVSPRAEPQVIQAAYRVLARSYHPDTSRHSNALRLMQQLNAAYDVLSDPERRAHYDSECAHSARVVDSKPTRDKPGRVHSRRRTRVLPVERRKVPPLARAMIAIIIAGLVVGLISLFWLIFDPSDAVGPLALRAATTRSELTRRTAESCSARCASSM